MTDPRNESGAAGNGAVIFGSARALVHKSWTEGEAVSGDVTDEGSDLRLCR
jgi:hypothetical protein